MKMSFTIMILSVMPFLSGADSLVLRNNSLKVTLAAAGGKIVKIEDAEGTVFETGSGLSQEYGLAKINFLRDDGDKGEFSKARWLLKPISERAAELSISAAGEKWNGLEIIKKMELPATGAWVRVETTFQVRKKLKIIPWIQHAWALEAEPQTWRILLPHENGISRIAHRKSLQVEEATLKAQGNWCGCYDMKRGRGMLFMHEEAPAVYYHYHDMRHRDITTVEVLFPERPADNTLEFRSPRPLVTYLVPFRNPAALPELPLAPSPEMPAKLDGDENVVPQQVALTSILKKKTDLPLEFRYFKDELQVAEEVFLPVYVSVFQRNSEGGTLVLELPEAVELKNYCAGFVRPERETLSLLDREEFRREGVPYVRYRFHAATYVVNKWHYPFARFFLKAKTGDLEGRMTLYAEIDGAGVGEKQSLPIRRVPLPAVRTPDEFVFVLEGDYVFFQHYPELIPTLRHLGINGVYLNYNVPSKTIPATEVRKMTESLRQAGIRVMNMGAYYFMPPVDQDPSLRAVDLNGRIQEAQHIAFDFTARGPWMKQVVDFAVDMTRDCGYEALISDFEGYHSARELSFTERTLSAFETYFNHNFKSLPYLNPREIAAEPGKYPEQEKIWVDFKCRQYADYLKSVITEYKERMPGMKVAFAISQEPTLQGCREAHLQDINMFAEFCDILAPMIYENIGTPSMVKAKLKMNIDAAGKYGRSVMPYYTHAFPYCSRACKPGYLTGMLVEAGMSGCDGVLFWPGFASATADGLAETGKAAEMIGRHSSLMRHGRRADELLKISSVVRRSSGIPAAVIAYGNVLKNRMLAALISYDDEPVSFALAIDCSGKLNARDAMTGESLGNAGAGVEPLRLSLAPEDRIRLLLFETTDGGDIAPAGAESIPVAQAAAAGSETVTLFEDSFEGEMKGRAAESQYRFKPAPAEDGTQCLFMSDFRGEWVYETPITLSGKSTVVSLRYKMPKGFAKGHQFSHRLWSLYFGGNRSLHMRFEKETGRLRVFEMNGEAINFARQLYSGIEQWGGNVWYDLRLEISGAGMKLYVNGRLDGKCERSIPPLKKIERMVLGGKWGSFGWVDDLKISESP